jgi:hypothetical protein
MARKAGHSDIAMILDPNGKSLPDPLKKNDALSIGERFQSTEGWVSSFCVV